MSFPKRTTAIAAAAALMASVGVAEATHKSGKAGAPGQVCKSVRVERKAALQEALKAAREDGRVTRQERQQIKALDRTYRAAYKGCIKAAVEARQADQRPAPTPTPGT